ncbi:MAG: serine/threonine-protein phosphatase [Clostridia bacterium]|nr:serine/threonine-protein phosphatase [Clostridia bacterium]
MRYTARTDIGQKRENNEDFLFAKIYDENTALFVVADGLGGYSSGEVASQMAVNSIKDNFELNLDVLRASDEEKIKQFFKQLIIVTNDKVFDVQKSNKKYNGMGTTITLVGKINGKLYYESVGDSRLYYIDANKENIEQITVDDTYVNELLKKKLIKKSEVENHPQKHMLTKAIGIFNKIDTQVDILNKKSGYMILCTDGLTNMLTSEDILQTVRLNRFLALSDIFVDNANRNGGTDNITVIVVEI